MSASVGGCLLSSSPSLRSCDVSSDDRSIGACPEVGGPESCAGGRPGRGGSCRSERPEYDTPSAGVSQGKNTRCCGWYRRATATCGCTGDWCCPRLVHLESGFVHGSWRFVHVGSGRCPRSEGRLPTGRTQNSRSIVASVAAWDHGLALPHAVCARRPAHQTFAAGWSVIVDRHRDEMTAGAAGGAGRFWEGSSSCRSRLRRPAPAAQSLRQH